MIVTLHFTELKTASISRQNMHRNSTTRHHIQRLNRLALLQQRLTRIKPFCRGLTLSQRQTKRRQLRIQIA
ncbi:Uncharacterised protein [Vibrio cholerae]|nr:Uncharacterised protein [Vibrio cholerae]